MSARISDLEHKLKGTRPTRAEDHGADIPAARPKFPRSLTPEAKAIFKLLVRQLEERRACTAGDMQILHLYAETHTQWVKARAKVEELGEVVLDTRTDSNGTAHEVLRKNPWQGLVETCASRMQSILKDLGLTPNARAKVKQLGEPAKPVDPMEDFLQQGRAISPAAKLADLDDFDAEVKQ
jgi:P27 family predicted phage terminase small subunit